MYLEKNCIDQNNVTYVSMATKYSILKHRAFFKTLTFLFPQIMKISFRVNVYFFSRFVDSSNASEPFSSYLSNV